MQLGWPILDIKLFFEKDTKKMDERTHRMLLKSSVLINASDETEIPLIYDLLTALLESTYWNVQLINIVRPRVLTPYWMLVREELAI